MNWLLKNFLRGLIIVVPIAVTVWVMYRAFIAIDRLFSFAVPGTGLAVIVIGAIAVGALASNYVVRKLLGLTEIVFTRAPLVRIVYAAIRDLLEAFVGDRKRFDRPVTVELSDRVVALGFVTRDDLGFLGLHDRVAVYLPFSYSVAGVVLTVPATSVSPLNSDSASVMALIVSGGITRM